jgi:hypothetical protein
LAPCLVFNHALRVDRSVSARLGDTLCQQFVNARQRDIRIATDDRSDLFCRPRLASGNENAAFVALERQAENVHPDAARGVAAPAQIGILHPVAWIEGERGEFHFTFEI